MPTPAEQPYTCVCADHRVLGTTPAPPDAPPPAALAALGAIDTAFGLSNAPRPTTLPPPPSRRRGARRLRATSPPPRTLTELLAKLEGGASRSRRRWRRRPGYRGDVGARARSAAASGGARPAQHDVEPALDQHALVERLQVTAAVRRVAATGATTRIVTLIGDDRVRYPFAVDVATPAPSRALRLERVSQLVRLLNRRLLESRECAAARCA